MLIKFGKSLQCSCRFADFSTKEQLILTKHRSDRKKFLIDVEDYLKAKGRISHDISVFDR